MKSMAHDFYRITDAQKSIWNTEQVYKDKPITNIVGTCTIEQKVDFDLLEKAINVVIKTNDALRIKISTKDDVPVQKIEAYRKKLISLYFLPSEKKLDDFMNGFLSEPLRYNNYLIKFIMYKFKNGKGGIGILANHIICDAWSISLIADQVIKTYDNLIENKNGIIEVKNNFSYTDFIDSEEEYKNSKKHERDKKYWEKTYEKMPETITTLKQHDENEAFETAAERKTYVITKSESNTIKKYCEENNITPYIFFMTIYSIYFLKLLGQEDITIGTPTLNRLNIKERNTIGMFVNSLPVRVKLSNDMTIDEAFQKVKEISFGVFRHERYSLFELLTYLKEAHGFNGSIYDVVFSFQNAMVDSNIKIPYKMKWYFNKNIGETINIHMTDIANTGSYTVHYDYKTSQFNENEIDNLNDRIEHIAKQIIYKHLEKINEIDILSKTDENIIKNINNTGTTKVKNETLVDRFESIVSKYPNRIALVCGKKKITYKEFNQEVNYVASILRENGVKRNTAVALIFDKSIEMMIAMFATIKAGGYYVPILPLEEQTRKEYILKDSNPVIVLTHKNYDTQVKKYKTFNLEKDINLESVLKQKVSDKRIKNLKKINNCNDIVYMIYTSGSTGNPKGTQLMHKNVLGLAKSMSDDKNLRPSQYDVSMSLLKYSFDASGIDIYSALLFGGKLVLIEKENELNPSAVVEIMEKEKVTRSFLIPKWIEQISNADKEQRTKLFRLKILGTGGETLKPTYALHLFKKYKRLKIINLYGPTETTMFTTYNVLKKKNYDENSVSIGKPIKYSRLLITNKFGEILPAGCKGELTIFTDKNSIQNIAKGYNNLPEINEKRFVKMYNPLIKENINCYKTGDIALINYDSSINYIGRDDDMVKVNGSYLVSLNEIESKIYKALNEKYKVFVVAVPFRESKIIIAFIEGAQGEDKLGLSKYINNRLTFYMRPKKIIVLEEFPRNSSGKINRTELIKIATEYINNRQGEIKKPKTPTEKIIYNTIEKQIGAGNISIEDDFVNDLGIDSLMMAKINSELNFYNIKIQDLYNYPTIESLAEFIDGSADEKEQIFKDIDIVDDAKKFVMDNILITGATGFLGIHILNECLNNPEIKKIYCIVRRKEFKSGIERIKENIKFYFKNYRILWKLIDEKVIVMEGNLAEKNFELEKSDYDLLKDNVDSVINCAANVKHYAKVSDLEYDNVTTVKNLLTFCENNISLAHISTLSILGFKSNDTENKIFDENTLYIKQDFGNNPYLLTKFKAESLILKNKNVNSKIFRMGNIMPRVSDGKFQINYTKNSFLNSIRNVVINKKVPKEILNQKLEFSPVDESAEFVVNILLKNKSEKIFHIVNNNLISVKELIKMLEDREKINIVTMNEYIQQLEENDTATAEYAKEYLLQGGLNPYSVDKTLKILEDIGLKWSEPNQNYVNKIYKLIKENKW